MKKGKLYQLNDEQFITDVNYQLYKYRESTEWTGELTISNGSKISENEIYVIELADGRKCLCKLRRKVNRAVSGIPPCSVYHAVSLGQI